VHWRALHIPINILSIHDVTLQERCRELEVQLADLNMDLQELNGALSRVEADAAASAEEKQQLRKEYERKIDGVVKQMAGLQQQMKQQVRSGTQDQNFNTDVWFDLVVVVVLMSYWL
jgi:peptidoglycan hydrolase CwlO-like protein